MASFVGNENLMADLDPSLVQGQTAGSYSSVMAAFFLTNEIELEVLAQAAEDQGVVVDDDDRSRAEIDLALQYAGSSLAAPEAAQQQAVTLGLDTLDGFNDQRRSQIVEGQAVKIALGDHLVDGVELDAAVANRSATCASHILVETEEEALAVLAAIEGGLDFQSAAMANSIDQASPGGDLGCQQAGTFVPEFEEALQAGQPGELVGPIQTQFGFHLIDIRDPRPVLAVELGRQAVVDLLADELSWAEIDVDSRWGTWTLDQNRLQVLPPRAPEPEPFDFAA
ncbi:MAG: hypothetical protein GY929_14735 [Actinomycetia bacterium]|nr:hypothetical protein [Actinomycetes bacterium]